MSCYLITLVKGRKMARPITSKEEYLALRNSAKQLDNLQKVRNQDEKAKKRLVQFNYSCIPNPDGSLRGSKTPSDTVGMDIDHIPAEEMEPMANRILEKKEELGLLMLERSARRQGYHPVFRRRAGMSQLENLQWASSLLGLEFDKAAKDITRVFYASSNSAEDLIYLNDALFEPQPLTSAPEAVVTVEAEPVAEEPAVEEKNYLGISYDVIIGKWWEMYNDGQTPVKSNRDVLTFELAVNLRHICGFDRNLMDSIIPCYDGFPYDQKMKCIDSALSEKRTQMPKRLKDVLQAVKIDVLRGGGDGSINIIQAMDAADAEDDLFHFNALPPLAQGVSDSIDAAGHTLAMPALIGIAPAIGALTTEVKLDVHGQAKGLNILSFIVGDFASGKGQMDDIIASWMKELQDETDDYLRQEAEWARAARRMKSGKTPEQPVFPVRMLTLNNTVANISERLSNAQGKHSFSFSPEADMLADRWRQSSNNYSVMFRQAYDESRHDREAKSLDAARAHIPSLKWNVLLCGTQDSLYRVLPNDTDGMLSRFSIARTPDNTFAKLDENPAHLTGYQSERIQQIAHLLPLLRGTLVLGRLEAEGQKWVEAIRLESMKNDDRTMASLRKRGCVTAMRITTALWIPKVLEKLIINHGMEEAERLLKQNETLWIEMMQEEQTDDMMKLFNQIADYLLDCTLYYFRNRMENSFNAMSSKGNLQGTRMHKGKNDTIFERLSNEFTLEQAFQQAVAVKGASITRNSVIQMLKNWKKQNLITAIQDQKFKKWEA